MPAYFGKFKMNFSRIFAARLRETANPEEIRRANEAAPPEEFDAKQEA